MNDGCWISKVDELLGRVVLLWRIRWRRISKRVDDISG